LSAQVRDGFAEICRAGFCFMDEKLGMARRRATGEVLF
jgi:hypothetical protein